MAQSNFVDYVKVFCRAGKGGAGSVHFRRTKRNPKGGPDGGNGGKGGDIILKASSRKWTLLHLRYLKHIYAENGERGGANLRTGKDGENVYIEVPLGTVVKDAETGVVIGEVVDEDDEIIVMRGGRGGLGNDHFKSATFQTPRFSQPGEEGDEGWIIIELKVLADVGLVGFPNAGKSTLLSVVSAAKPEIASYPFTTLVPNLGMVQYKGENSFVIADIPGIIEGAAEGKGLGHRFLRHIERNSILLFLISITSENIKEEFNILINELQKYNPELLDKPRLLAITKIDLVPEDEIAKVKKDLPKEIESIFISSVTNKNVDKLKDKLWLMLNEPIAN